MKPRPAAKAPRAHTAPALVALALAAAPALAQPCGPGAIASPEHAFPGVFRSVPSGPAVVNTVTRWDPDGPGPRTPVLVMGGDFTDAGDLELVRGVVAYDPATLRWERLEGLPLPANAVTNALAVLPTGELALAGNYGVIVGTGTTWSTLGGLPGLTLLRVTALTVLPSGQLTAALITLEPGWIPGFYAVTWTGNAWQTLGESFDDDINALVVLPSGELVAGGDFTRNGSVPARDVARWDGSAWSPVGTAPIRKPRDLAVTPAGELLAAGEILVNGNVAGAIARFEGNDWVILRQFPHPLINSLDVLPDGRVIAGTGLASVPGQPWSSTAYAYEWDGQAWTQLNTRFLPGSGVAINAAAPLPGGEVLVAGGFSGVMIRYPSGQGVGETSATAGSVAAVGPSGARPLGRGLNGLAGVVLPLASGDVVLGGQFSHAGGQPARGAAIWDGVGFRALSTGLSAGARISDVLPLPDGSFAVAGSGLADSGIPSVARVTDTGFTGLGEIRGLVRRLALLPNGDLIAAGQLLSLGFGQARRILRWDGSSWQSLASELGSSTFDDVRALVLLPNGELLVGGRFSVAGNEQASNIARWDGSTWSPLGQGVSGAGSSTSVRAILPLPGGDVIVGGEFTTAGAAPASNIARWDGSAWSPLGQGLSFAVRALLRLPSGDLLAGTTGGLFRWDGTTWHALAKGQVESLALHRSGEVIVGGTLALPDDRFASNWARFTLTGVPWAARDPRPTSVRATGTASFTALPASGYDAISATWELETAPGSGLYAPLPDGPIPGTASTAATTQPVPGSALETAAPATLTVSNASTALADRRVRAVLSGPCGSSASAPALLTVAGTPSCYADCDGSGGSPALSALDLSCFLARYQAAQRLPEPDRALHYANCDGSTTLPALNALDFACFLARYRAGCP